MAERDWWKAAIIYELYVDKFAGNFRGLTEKLDYFTWLGVNTLWILPHYPSPMVDGGYDIVDYRGVRSELGTVADLEKFVDEAHKRGLRVMIDMVLNHTSIDHPWFRQRPEWYLWSDNSDSMPLADIAFPDIKEKNWVWDEKRQKYYYATFYPQQPDLNWDNPEVVTEMLGVMDYWLGKGVDGMRLDAVSRLIKREGTNCFGLPETHQMLKKIRAHVEEGWPGTVLLAETGGWPDEARQFFGVGDECQMVMHFQLAPNMLLDVLNKNRRRTQEAWKWSGAVPPENRWAVFLTNHDSVDVWFLAEADRNEFISRVDPEVKWSWQVGQSMAVRLAEVCQGNPDLIVEATQMLLDQPGVPIIYYGNEIGMRNENRTEKPRDTRAFVRGQFDWEEADRQMRNSGSILNRVRSVIRSEGKNNFG